MREVMRFSLLPSKSLHSGSEVATGNWCFRRCSRAGVRVARTPAGRLFCRYAPVIQALLRTDGPQYVIQIYPESGLVPP